MKLDTLKLQIAMAKTCMPSYKLCELSGIAAPTFVRIKSGKQNPRPETIGKICKALGVDVLDLIKEVE